MFEFTADVKYSELGAGETMALPCLFDRMQDCAVFQVEEAGRGPFMWEREMRSWIIASWQVVIRRMPRFGDKLVTQTWPYYFKGFGGGRNFRILTDKGEVLAEADSDWVYFDVAKRRPIRVPPEELAIYHVEEPLDTFEFAGRRIYLPDIEPEELPAFAVDRTVIDNHKHVNNKYYVTMALAYLPLDFKVREVRVQYIHECMLGDMLYPKIYRTDGCFYVSLEKSQGQVCAIVLFMV